MPARCQQLPLKHWWDEGTREGGPPQTTILLGGSVMEEKLREVNRIKGSYALVDRYGEEERVAWMHDLVD
ncbi:hypothetical protein JOQ06_011603 [Pogonophryne albipinna]|uniref:Uncharacterized protein n=1 Tax=Pogonophryne albipinna TaxID=1090488 RepID=A0AAD6BBP5_9TELE|nr:hypothetical protein JOQ06_011603 [Pogonophryne albipinna]